MNLEMEMECTQTSGNSFLYTAPDAHAAFLKTVCIALRITHEIGGGPIEFAEGNVGTDIIVFPISAWIAFLDLKSEQPTG
jgi:hypothetical protein